MCSLVTGEERLLNWKLRMACEPSALTRSVPEPRAVLPPPGWASRLAM